MCRILFTYKDYYFDALHFWCRESGPNLLLILNPFGAVLVSDFMLPEWWVFLLFHGFCKIVLIRSITCSKARISAYWCYQWQRKFTTHSVLLSITKGFLFSFCREFSSFSTQLQSLVLNSIATYCCKESLWSLIADHLGICPPRATGLSPVVKLALLLHLEVIINDLL